MNWYDFGYNRLSALRILLNKPLEFDATEYINRTFDSKSIPIEPNVRELTQLFDQSKASLFAQVSGVSNLLTESSNYWSPKDDKTVIPYSHRQVDNTKISKQRLNALSLHTFDSINIQIDRLFESFQIQSCYGDNFSKDLNDFLSFYLLSEILFFVLVDMAIVQKDGNRLIIKPASQTCVEQLHRKWFANFWEKLSSTANIAYFDYLPKGADKLDDFKNLIELFGLSLRDKVFSIPISELPNKLRRLEGIAWISKICNLAALCMWCQMKNEMDYAPNHLIEKIGLNINDINKLRLATDEHSQPDKVFLIMKKGVRIENPNMSKLLRTIINDIANNLSEELNQPLGDFFEKKYIRKRLSGEGFSENFDVHDGFFPHDVKSDEYNPDVDFILEDKSKNIFYFIQVKYLRTGGKAYISGDLEHILSGKLVKGVNQLRHAKKAMEDGKLRGVLTERKLHNCNQRNSYFLLIHNISNFDFCLWSSGIISYEWNSLRNLLRNGMINIGHSKAKPTAYKHSNSLPIENPDLVMNYLINKSPASKLSGAFTLFETDDVAVDLEFGSKKVLSCGFGL